jgi:hypothetical protein
VGCQKVYLLQKAKTGGFCGKRELFCSPDCAIITEVGTITAEMAGLSKGTLIGTMQFYPEILRMSKGTLIDSPVVYVASR